MCNDPAVTIAMAANSACLLGCRMMLYQWDVKRLILLLIGIAGSRMDTAECGFPPSWAPTAPTAQLESRQEEERHLSLGRHVGCGGLGSAQILPETPTRSLGFYIRKSCGSSWSSWSSCWRGKQSAQGLTLHCTTPHRAHSSRVSVADMYFYRCATAAPVQPML